MELINVCFNVFLHFQAWFKQRYALSTLQPCKLAGWYPINLSEVKLGRHRGVKGDQNKKSRKIYLCVVEKKNSQRDRIIFTNKKNFFSFEKYSISMGIFLVHDAQVNFS